MVKEAWSEVFDNIVPQGVNVSLSVEGLNKVLKLDELRARVDDNASNIATIQKNEVSQEEKILALEVVVNEHYVNLCERVGELEQKWDCIIHLIHAIQYSYEYWDYFLAFKKACGCETYLDIAAMNAGKAHKTLVEYNRNEKCISGRVAKEAVTKCIDIARALTSYDKQGV